MNKLLKSKRVNVRVVSTKKLAGKKLNCCGNIRCCGNNGRVRCCGNSR